MCMYLRDIEYFCSEWQTPSTYFSEKYLNNVNLNRLCLLKVNDMTVIYLKWTTKKVKSFWIQILSKWFISKIKSRDFEIYFFLTVKTKTSKVWLMTMNMCFTLLIFQAKFEEKRHISYSDLYLDIVYVGKNRTEVGNFVYKRRG